MQSFKFQSLPALALGMAASSVLAADVSLKGDSKLSGDITGIASDGTITLLSPMAEKALMLNADQVRRVAFGDDVAAPAIPEQRIELSNGDILPVKVMSLEGEILKVQSPILGTLAIPRDAVSSLQLGIVPKKIIYSGQKGGDGWTRDENGVQAWEYEDGRFIATGQGTLTRDVRLPGKFILKFTFGWQNNPNSQLCFAHPPLSPGARQDQYIAEFSGSGFGVFRESTNRIRTPIILLSRSPQQVAKRSVDVEIRVDRTQGLLELHIDGELTGRYKDPLEPIPEGTFVSLVSNAGSESGQFVRDLMILDWDDRGDRHRSEERGDGKVDSLIGRYGERFGGKLQGIRPNGVSTVYVFQSDFQKEPLELPEEEVSTLFLGGQGKPSKSATSGGLILGLRGLGTMRVSSCVLDGGTVKAEHPLLGSLVFGREGLSSLERIWIPKAKTVNDR
ncbi:MAG: hypothetical protein RLZZ505_2255 [Verrucomicrobiota bacterium]|jgi:hypothetical protein